MLRKLFIVYFFHISEFLGIGGCRVGGGFIYKGAKLLPHDSHWDGPEGEHGDEGYRRILIVVVRWPGK